MCGHRDTIAYPATQNATGSIASIPYAAYSIIRPSCPVLTGAVWANLGRRSGENVISCYDYARRARAGSTMWFPSGTLPSTKPPWRKPDTASFSFCFSSGARRSTRQRPCQDVGSLASAITTYSCRASRWARSSPTNAMTMRTMRPGFVVASIACGK